jgi:para-aminobenzoate synthetase component 1
MQIKSYSNTVSSRDLVDIFCPRELGFALDSTQLVDTLGGWSFYGSEPFELLTGDDDLLELRKLMRPYKEDTFCEIPFLGGAVGFISYDYGRCLETIPSISANDLVLPNYCFGLYDGIVAKNSATGEVFLIASEVKESAEATFSRLESIIQSHKTRTGTEADGQFSFSDWRWDTSKEAFCASVEQIKAHIASGEVYQVNLSRRRDVVFDGALVDLYQALRKGNPAPYSGFFNGEGVQLISTSPEQFLKKSGDNLVTRPIKGTRPRGKTEAEDRLLAKDLELSEKDRAELLMIIDLERNDLGRIAEFGSVSANTDYNIEYYKSVMHATAEVKAKLSPKYDVFDAIHSMFPGGSITGAPKIKSMEIIEKLEKHRRGLYCGSFGYIGFNQDAEFNISIRTLQHTKDRLYYNVGSGIVWDSDPEAEYLETAAKGLAIETTLKSLCLE